MSQKHKKKLDGCLLLFWRWDRFTRISMRFELVFETCVRVEGKSLCVEERSCLSENFNLLHSLLQRTEIVLSKHRSSNTEPFSPFVRSPTQPDCWGGEQLDVSWLLFNISFVGVCSVDEWLYRYIKGYLIWPQTMKFSSLKSELLHGSMLGLLGR